MIFFCSEAYILPRYAFCACKTACIGVEDDTGGASERTLCSPHTSNCLENDVKRSRLFSIITCSCSPRWMLHTRRFTSGVSSRRTRSPAPLFGHAQMQRIQLAASSQADRSTLCSLIIIGSLTRSLANNAHTVMHIFHQCLKTFFHSTAARRYFSAFFTRDKACGVRPFLDWGKTMIFLALTVIAM